MKTYSVTCIRTHTVGSDVVRKGDTALLTVEDKRKPGRTDGPAKIQMDSMEMFPVLAYNWHDTDLGHWMLTSEYNGRGG